MARRWLLQVLAGATIAVGMTAAPAFAQELPVTAVEAEVPPAGSVTITPTTEPSASVEADPTLRIDEADTAIAPDAAAGISPSGPTATVEGPTRVGGRDLPVADATDPIQDLVDAAPAPSLPTTPLPTTPLPPFATAPNTQPAGDGSPSAAPAPSGSRDGDAARDTGSGSVPRGFTRGFTAPSGSYEAPSSSAFDGILAPEIAPAAVREGFVAAPESPVLALPATDSIPSVPAALRLMAAIMVVGAGLTWRMVHGNLA